MIYRQRFQEGVLGNGYDVVVCERCGVGFADFIPEQAALDTYYREQSKYTYDASGGSESKFDFHRFELIVRQVEQVIPKNARILDVGCATGGLLAVFKKHGFSHIMGVDPSGGCAEAAARLHGVQVRTATISELGTWTESFDLILFVGVLEHLRELQPAIGLLRRRLSKGGLLYVAVPDVDGFADCWNAPYQQFSMEHLGFFSVQSLRRLFVVAGGEVIRVWRDRVEWRGGVWEPVVGILLRFETGPTSDVLPKDTGTQPALERYVQMSAAVDTQAEGLIETLVATKEPIFVWGTGALTRRLMASTSLAKANILGFINGNAKDASGMLDGRAILPPAEVRGRKERVLICSVAFEMEIRESAATMGLEVFPLYTRPPYLRSV